LFPDGAAPKSTPKVDQANIASGSRRKRETGIVRDRVARYPKTSTAARISQTQGGVWAKMTRILEARFMFDSPLNLVRPSGW
jgi:hypothetical protein